LTVKKRGEAREEKPDLILMDIVNARMTGLEACRVLKKDKATEKIPGHLADDAR